MGVDTYLPPRDAAELAAQHLGQAVELIDRYSLGGEGAYRVTVGAGVLSAVLDWQHGCVGHRGFDLIGLEWDLALRLDMGSAPALALVTARVDELVEETVRTFCRAYYGVWNLSWALDTPDEEAVLLAANVIGVA